MVTMSDIREQMKPILNMIEETENDGETTVENVTLTISMKRDVFIAFMKGRLCDIADSCIDVYQDDPQYIESFISFLKD